MRLHKLPIQERSFPWGSITTTYVGGSGDNDGQREILIPLRVNRDEEPDEDRWDYRYSKTGRLLIQANLQKDAIPGVFLRLSSFVPDSPVKSISPILGFIYTHRDSLENVGVLAIGYIGAPPTLGIHQEAIVRVARQAEFYVARNNGIDLLVRVDGYKVDEKVINDPGLMYNPAWLKINNPLVPKLYRGKAAQHGEERRNKDS